MALVGATAVLTLTGCADLTREAMCADDAYPVWPVNAPDSGRTCVPNGQEPPTGYACYPMGHVPHWTDEDYNPMTSASPGKETTKPPQG
jgi:hypothetical protein